tara:strand:- start:154 stop:783 length:630 start_codon:yes stop_codon:yes gene_type:complete
MKSTVITTFALVASSIFLMGQNKIENFSLAGAKDLAIGQKTTILTDVEPNDAMVSWTLLGENVEWVSEPAFQGGFYNYKGVIKATNPGTYSLTANIGTTGATVSITSGPFWVSESVKLNLLGASDLDLGQNQVIRAQVTPNYVDLKWEIDGNGAYFHNEPYLQKITGNGTAIWKAVIKGAQTPGTFSISAGFYDGSGTVSSSAGVFYTQ